MAALVRVGRVAEAEACCRCAPTALARMLATGLAHLDGDDADALDVKACVAVLGQE